MKQEEIELNNNEVLVNENNENINEQQTIEKGKVYIILQRF